MIQVELKAEERIRQGDILKNVEMIEYAAEDNGIIEISKILFPYVFVLSQDCDLEQDYGNRLKNKTPEIQNTTKENHDKFLMSVIIAPMYNYEHVLSGSHLSNLNMKMQSIQKNKTPDQNLKNNSNPRFHYIEFPNNITIASQVIDFKHYFTCNLHYLEIIKEANFVCSVSPLYRELISQRFANFLSRIGLPEIKSATQAVQ